MISAAVPIVIINLSYDAPPDGTFGAPCALLTKSAPTLGMLVQYCIQKGCHEGGHYGHPFDPSYQGTGPRDDPLHDGILYSQLDDLTFVEVAIEV